jgi:cilia- and flagella-associated protein 52
MMHQEMNAQMVAPPEVATTPAADGGLA